MSGAEAGLAVVSGTRLTDRIGVGVLTRLIGRDLVDDVLAQTGRVEQRSRLLPARVVVYYVLGLCLFFGEAYEEVMPFVVGDGWEVLGGEAAEMVHLVVPDLGLGCAVGRFLDVGRGGHAVVVADLVEDRCLDA